MLNTRKTVVRLLTLALPAAKISPLNYSNNRYCKVSVNQTWILQKSNDLPIVHTNNVILTKTCGLATHYPIQSYSAILQSELFCISIQENSKGNIPHLLNKSFFGKHQL